MSTAISIRTILTCMEILYTEKSPMVGPREGWGWGVVHHTVTGGTTQALTMWGQFVEGKKKSQFTLLGLQERSRLKRKKKKKRPQPLTNVMGK